MSKKAFIIFVAALAALAALGVFLFLRLGAPDGTIEEYDFKPLTQEQLEKIVEETTAPSGSLLTAQEERAIIASTSAPSSGSLLTPEEERALVESMTAPGN